MQSKKVVEDCVHIGFFLENMLHNLKCFCFCVLSLNDKNFEISILIFLVHSEGT